MSAADEAAFWDAQIDTAGLDAVWPVDDWEPGQEACIDALTPGLVDAGWALDLGCGVGRLAVPILQQYPKLRVMGVDVSPRMLHWARAVRQERLRLYQCDGRTIPVPQVPAPYYVCAWAVGLFDHLEFETVCGYLDEVRTMLHDGAPFRFQVSVGDTPEELFEHRHDVDDLVKACADAWLDVTAVDAGLVKPDWVWVTAVRR